METFPFTANLLLFHKLAALHELDQNRTDIYFRDREVLYLFKLLILGDKRFELLKAIAIEFTAQPFLPIKELSFI